MLLEEVFQVPKKKGKYSFLIDNIAFLLTSSIINESINPAIYEQIGKVVSKMMDEIKERRPDLFETSSGQARSLIRALNFMANRIQNAKIHNISFWEEDLDGDKSIGFEFNLNNNKMYGLWNTTLMMCKIAPFKVPVAKYSQKTKNILTPIKI